MHDYYHFFLLKFLSLIDFTVCHLLRKFTSSALVQVSGGLYSSEAGSSIALLVLPDHTEEDLEHVSIQAWHTDLSYSMFASFSSQLIEVLDTTTY